MSLSSYASCNGKSAVKLAEEDKLYIAVRSYGPDFFGNISWSRWMSLSHFMAYAQVAYPEGMVVDDGKETKLYFNSQVSLIQYAIFDTAPDMTSEESYFPTDDGKKYYLNYSTKPEIEESISEITPLYTNEAYGTYTTSPYVNHTTPILETELVDIADSMRDPAIEKVMMDKQYAYDIKVTYSDELHIIDPEKPIGINVLGQRSNFENYIQLLPVNENGDLVELIDGTVSAGQQSFTGKNTLRFKFCPSLMWEHDSMGYYFTFTNVGSAKEVEVKQEDGTLKKVMSNKAPNSPYFAFGREYIACPACFNYDGRLWIECIALPTLVDTSDLSAMEFEDENGKSTFTTDRSQMMLVVDKYDEQAEKKIKDEIVASENTDIKAEDIKSSETYEIKLGICGKYKKITDGSYVKIALGFPEGYGPEDEGVTFKLFHRKHIQGDEYIIEEIPCVVTQFGIVATVKSFSPYTVVVVPKDTVTTKNVYASIEGKGGKLSKEDGEILSLKETDDIKTKFDDTYHTYNITPADGYQIYSVKLNGVEIKDKLENGKLTLRYADTQLRADNELEIQFIAETAAQKFAHKEADGFEKVEPVKVYVQPGTLYPEVNAAPSNDNGWVKAIIIIAGALVISAGAIAIAVVVKKKRNNG